MGRSRRGVYGGRRGLLAVCFALLVTALRSDCAAASHREALEVTVDESARRIDNVEQLAVIRPTRQHKRQQRINSVQQLAVRKLTRQHKRRPGSGVQHSRRQSSTSTVCQAGIIKQLSAGGSEAKLQSPNDASGTVVSLTFTEITLSADVMSVVDGSNWKCPLGKLTDISIRGNQTYKASTAAGLYVLFVSFGSNDGFTAVYKAVPVPSVPPPAPSPFYMQQDAALRALYHSTGGPKKWQMNWEDGFHNNCTMCGWFGVFCDAAQQQVKRLLLPGNSLSGLIPAELSTLSSLVSLDLSSNSLRGTIFEAVGNLNQLTRLDLSSNSFYGTIPQSLYNCSKLQYLDLDTNINLDGTISEAVGNLKELRILYLFGTSLRGTIPESLYDCDKLNILALSSNALTGTISAAVGQLNQLSTLELNSNSLRGIIPESLYDCDKLTQLSLHSNALTGTISAAVGQLDQLTQLNLGSNSLRGTIPKSLYNCNKLTLLWLHNNALTGTISAAVGQLNQLTQLDLGSNSLRGTIPESLYDCDKLNILVLSINALTGTISAAVGQLNQLTQLYLWSNLLRGTIPESLYNCIKLTQLWLNTNALTGTISAAVGQLNQLAQLDLEGNSLRGIIPESLYNCTKLTHFSLYSNALTGTISVAVGQLNQLTQLDLANNSLRGTIPESLYDCNKLNILSLFANALTGTISAAVGQLNQLIQLGLGSNSLRGSIPESLYNCDKLTLLWLSTNALSGTISAVVRQLNQLTRLALASNSLRGTIPESLYNCNKLTHLSLRSNALSGTISEAVQHLNKLVFLNLLDNSLHGTIPESLYKCHKLTALSLSKNALIGSISESFCKCSTLEKFHLHTNSLTGNLPPCLGNMPALSQLGLHNNSLSGSFPAVNGGWNKLTLLDLGSNKFTGIFPNIESYGLLFLNLNNNWFHGTVPHTLASMHQLAILLLSRNSFTGPLPKLNSSILNWALFDRNQFNGKVPWQSLLSKPTQLQVLSLASNRLSGSIVTQLPSSLIQLLLDNNHFTGALPSFMSLHRLQALTVHENQFRGKLHLPQNANALTAVFAHNNRGLSCPISGGEQANDTYIRKHNLLLAGNRFSSPIPSWAAMHDAPAMYVITEFDQWKQRVVYLIIGLPLLLGCVVAIHKTAVPEFFVFKPAAGYEHLQWWSAKAIGVMCVAFLLVMLPLYAEGSNLYECGEVWLKATSLTYLSDSIAIEWLVAVLACAAAVVQSFVLVGMRHEVNANFPPAVATQHVMPWSAYVKIVLLWSVVLVLFSVPTVLYILSIALPTDNTLGLNAALLEVSHQVAVMLLYLIVVGIAPYTADWLVRKVTGHAEPNAYLTTRLVLVTRLMVGVLVPTAVVFVFSNECMSFWLYLWPPCADDASSFDVSVELLPSGNYAASSFSQYFTSFAHPYTVTTHSQICQPTWKQQRCSRAVFSAVGDLILSKVTLLAFLGPGARALRNLVKPRIWKLLKKDSRLYRSDVEMSQFLMIFEYTLIFGFVMPLMLPLMVTALLLNCAVYRCAVRTLKLPTHDAVRPSFEYLYVARVIGVAALMWFFVDNALHGQLLVCIGVPACAIVGDLIASRVWAPASLKHRNSHPLRMLLVPLIGPDEGKSQDQGLIEMSDDPLLDAMVNNGDILKASEASLVGTPMESYEIHVTQKASKQR